MELDDGEAVVRSLAGDPEAFAILVSRHGPAVHSYLFRRSDRQTADDLIGEVWVRAFHSRQGYDQEWPVARPWLYGIAANVLRAHWRQRPVDHGDAVASGDDAWSEAEARLDAARRWPALRAALAALCPEDREVLLLVAWEQLSPTEVAVSLGLPAGTVRWRLHRARHLVQTHLDRDASFRSALPKEA